MGRSNPSPTKFSNAYQISCALNCALGDQATTGHANAHALQRRSRRPRAARRTRDAFSPTRWQPPTIRRAPRPLSCSHLINLQLGLGLVTVTNPVVAPTPTALTHHAHASCHAHTTHTTTQAAPSDRHPLTEGMRPGTGMQAYLSQATLAASEPRRSPGDSARTPKPARQRRHTPSLADRRAAPARTTAAAGLWLLWRR